MHQTDQMATTKQQHANDPEHESGAATGGFVDRDLLIRIGHDELLIRRRYETLSIINDILAGVMFVVGSVLFFSPSTAVAGTWLFVIGSVSMLLRPTIRLTRRFHLIRACGDGDKAGAHETSMDF